MEIISPEYIQFYPTLKCNYHCSFCFNRGLSQETDTDIHHFEDLVSLFSETGVKEIDILGGEPTLHPEFSRIMEMIWEKKLKATISTNGSSISLLRNLSKKYNPDTLKIGISVHSDVIHEELHNYIITHRPMLKNVFTKERAIPESCLPYIGLAGIEYYLLFMETLYKEDLKNSLPFYEFYERLTTFKQTYDNLEGVFCSGFIPDIENYPVLNYVRCPAGTTKLSILPDGSVYPCYLFFRYEEFKLGNILNDDFQSIWESPILDYFRRFKKNTCTKTDCELLPICHGGCPAMSYMFYKDMEAPDPRCVTN